MLVSAILSLDLLPDWGYHSARLAQLVELLQ
jgi:hypothetical protein